MTAALDRGSGFALLIAAATGSVACDDKEQAKAVASAPAPSASVAPEPQAPWYQGTWSGTFEAKRYPIEMAKAEGMLKAWEDDDGEAASGKGTLTVVVDEAKQATGNVTGPLGELELVGALDEDTLRLRLLTPSQPEVAQTFSGFVVADKQSETRFSGELKASSGDSLILRHATIALDKGEENPAAKSPSKSKPAAPAGP